jgi:uncharacterized membrane protein HdeD (DUF308 family)
MPNNYLRDNPIVAGINSIRSSWGWFFAGGILLTLLGVGCILYNVTATFATVMALGWLFIFSAAIAMVQAFQMRSWGGFFPYFLSAVFRGFTGFLLLRYTFEGAFALTLVLASFFVVTGLFRAIAATMLKFPSWGWSAFSGVITVALGIMLLVQMPVSSLWFIGFAIGVDMVFEGAALIGFGTALRSIPKLATVQTKAA